LPSRGKRDAAPRLLQAFAVRQPDRTSKVYLQQIAQTETGPAIVSTIELQEISDLKPYVTDIRPENSSGMIKEPGLFATIYLKTDPAADSDGWTVLIDEFGDTPWRRRQRRGAVHRAIQLFMEKQNRSNFLFLRNSRQKRFALCRNPLRTFRGVALEAPKR
jgi:hypothetical protein